MNIKIYSNNVVGGFSPMNYGKDLRGSEEVLCIISNKLAENGHHVIVYYSPEKEGTIHNNGNLSWLPHSMFNPSDETDVFISFKNRNIWKEKINAKTKIHWSMEVEPMFDLSDIDYFVSMTYYHMTRNFWVDRHKHKIIGNPIKEKYYSKSNSKKENTILYTSSPDRGLFTLLRDWQQIKDRYSDLQLKITYGFDLFDKIVGKNNYAEHFKAEVFKLMRQEDVHYLGNLDEKVLDAEYKKAKYWVLPLDNPESELFCISAVKAQLSNCIPVITRVGALRNTCKTWINYHEFIGGLCKINVNSDIELETYNENFISKKWNKLIR